MLYNITEDSEEEYKIKTDFAESRVQETCTKSWDSCFSRIESEHRNQNTGCSTNKSNK
jgi:hypothetical protein